jgi:hypothetical protein
VFKKINKGIDPKVIITFIQTKIVVPFQAGIENLGD